MFTIAFRNGSGVAHVDSTKSAYNEEFIYDPYKKINIKARIGESFMDFFLFSLITVTGKKWRLFPGSKSLNYIINS